MLKAIIGISMIVSGMLECNTPVEKPVVNNTINTVSVASLTALLPKDGSVKVFPPEYDSSYFLIASFVVIPPTEKEIKGWAENGAICKALGHVWSYSGYEQQRWTYDKNGTPDELVKEGWYRYRNCKLCKQHESRGMGEWK